MNYAVKLGGTRFLSENFLEESQLNLNQFTIQCWLKTKSSGALFYHKSQDKGFSLEVTPLGEIVFSVQTQTTHFTCKTVQGGISNGEWMYLVVSKQENEVLLTVNGRKALWETLEENGFPHQNTKDFIGELGGVTIWNRALALEEIITYYGKPIVGNESGIVISHPFKKEDDLQRGSAGLDTDETFVSIPVQTVEIEIVNDSPHEFILIKAKDSNDWPDTIPANKTTTVKFTSELSHFESYANYSLGEDEESITYLNIEVEKNLSIDQSKSYISAQISDDLDKQIKVNKNEKDKLVTHLYLSENLVIVNAKNLNKFLNKVVPILGKEHVITSMNYDEATGQATSSGEQIVRYNQLAQIFNRRIQKKPLAIINCRRTEDVQLAYLTSKEFNLPIKVRSGGHDHEGECTGTNVILIDLIGLNQFNVFTGFRDGVYPMQIAAVGPGNRFNALTPELASDNRMIPHGTCATVAIPGFTMGGGWGPWTRRHGMCCEHVVGAEIVLGNGEVETIASETIKAPGDGRDIILLKKNKPELLWALKGGGGMSYGIVTKFYINTFKLMPTLVKFELEWNKYDCEEEAKYPTIEILKRWEAVIESKNTSALTGTNLKINGKPLKITGYKDENKCFPEYEELNTDTVVHNCVMYGYWESKSNHEETIEELKAFVKAEFADYGVEPTRQEIDGIGGLGRDYTPNLGMWDRESHVHIKLKAQANGEDALPYPPDLDDPAPHKITSRLVDFQGLGAEGHKQLLTSLTSPLILDGNREEGLFTYVTLGAIVGDFYNNMKPEDRDKSSFPYKDKKYTIQYQTWWNLELEEKEKLQNNKVYNRVNRALDWIEASRDFNIDNTSGAFISFKDNSIPTKTYFAQNYERLICIKKHYSQDPENHFRSRKTII